MKFIVVTVLALLTALSVHPQNMTDLEKLVETEKAFAKAAREQGVRRAFLEFLADDAVVFQPAATNGKAFWQARPESDALLAWNPVWADISADGVLGYTTGDWEFRPEGKTGNPVAFGQYITIWKKQADGKFKAVLDIGNSHDRPEKTQSVWRSPKEKGKGTEPKITDMSVFVEKPDYQKLLAADVRIYRDDKFPFIGRRNALKEIEKEQKNTKTGNVENELCTGQSDLTYCYGVLKRNLADGSAEQGNLLRIWKFRNGKWQIVLEIYTRAAG